MVNSLGVNYHMAKKPLWPGLVSL